MPGLSATSAAAYTVLAACAAFIAGRATSIYYIGVTESMPSQFNTKSDVKAFAMEPSQHANTGNSFFPPPELISGKEAPKTKYTSMISGDVLSATSNSATLHLLVDKDSGSSLNKQNEEVCIQTAEGDSKCSFEGFNEADYEALNQQLEASNDTESEEDHLPAGQHLLIDIERVNSEFLNSEVRLAKAMVDVVNESKLTLLSYHCHKLVPMGVSCVGVLLESHISFHTWPEAGVITLDLFTCGSGKLIPVLPNLRKLFAIPRDGSSDAVNEQPRTLWNHKLRGYRQPHHEGYIQTDLMDQILESSSFDLKEEIASVQTPFQRIDIYDILEAGDDDYEAYERSLLGGDTYEARNPLFFNPNRIVYLDGVMQSEREGNEAYHETLVHPAMFLHRDPERVAIIGGGEGATLREVLKHDTVEKVKMIEIDEMMVTVSREFLPDWNNCTDLIGSAAWCGDDERAELHYVDAFGWFNNRFAKGVDVTEEKFDVLIMDALDPEDDIPFAEMLYNDYDFVETLYNSLNDDGVIVLQLGEASDYDDPAEQLTKSSRRVVLIELLEEVGFESLHFFEDGNCGFEAPWAFLVAMKDADIDSRWYMSDSELEVAIHERIKRTVSGTPALKYFDGAVKRGYHYPHKSAETVYCRTEPKPESCKAGVDAARVNIPLSDFEVKMSSIGDGSGRGVYTKVDIKRGDAISKPENSRPVYANAATVGYIEEYFENDDRLLNYLDGYGWDFETFGGKEYYVDSTIMTFVNHGCNGTFNIIDWNQFGGKTFTENNVTRDDAEDESDSEVYDIYSDRHVQHAALTYSVATRDIKAGEELFSNYLFYTTESWWDDVKRIRRMCTGKETGFITTQEMKNKEA